MWTLAGRLGIVSAAAGVALGSVLMVLAQLPSFLRHVGLPRRWRVGGPAVTLGAFAPIAVYTLARQAQVFVERFLGSSLPPGTISHLNYAQKVAQMPMLVALLVCTVTFPALARSVAAGEAEPARRRLEADLRTVTALIFVSAAYLSPSPHRWSRCCCSTASSPPRTPPPPRRSCASTPLGLIGHALVGVLSRAVLHRRAAHWYPAVAMGVGLAVTAVLAVAGRAVPARVRDRRGQRSRHHHHRRPAAGRAAATGSSRSRCAAVGGAAAPAGPRPLPSPGSSAGWPGAAMAGWPPCVVGAGRRPGRAGRVRRRSRTWPGSTRSPRWPRS